MLDQTVFLLKSLLPWNVVGKMTVIITLGSNKTVETKLRNILFNI